MSQGSSEEKTLPASDKKLREARKKGQIAHSRDMVTAVVTLVAFGYLLVRGGVFFADVRDGLVVFPSFFDHPFDQAGVAIVERLGADIALALTPLIGLIVASAILSNIVLNGGVIAALDPVLPKMERLDPIAGFKRVFGMRGLIEALKAAIKVLAIGGLTAYLIRGALGALVELPPCGMGCVPGILTNLLTRLIVVISGVFIVVAAFDIYLQRWLFAREMRMTKTEQKREHKESMGDPLIKKQHQQERRGSGAKTGLRNATFIMRSSDVALALRYAPPDALVPVLVAKGAQESARALLDEARQYSIPVVFDADSVAFIAPKLKVGALIAPDMFQAVIASMRTAKIL